MISVFILTEWWDHEGETIIGVFSSLEKAKDHEQTLRRPTGNGWGYDIGEYFIDALKS